MRFVASANRSRPSRDKWYSLSLPARRPSSHPSFARRAVAVRTNRSLSPNGAARAIRLPSATAPPRGMIESPKIVTMSEPPRSGRCRRKRAMSSVAAVEALAVIFHHCNSIGIYDTENIDFCEFVYHTGCWLTPRGGRYVHASTGYPRCRRGTAGRGCARTALPRADRRRREDRAQRLDAGALSQHLDSSDFPARAL